MWIQEGVRYPAAFFHKDRNLLTLVNGDDYVTAGKQQDIDWLEVQLEVAYEIQMQKIALAKNCYLEGNFLNRIIRCGKDDWRLEADPRHAELIVEQLGVGNLRAAATPGVDGREELDNEEDVAIEGADATRFRGVAARCKYLAFDRPDIKFATKEVRREMAKPTSGSLRIFRRIGQHFNGKPWLAWNFDVRNANDRIDVLSDSDWAACGKSRTSSSGNEHGRWGLY